jgi:hypothetical protein
MNFCAALYTQSFLYIFVCALLSVEATLQKSSEPNLHPYPSLSLLLHPSQFPCFPLTSLSLLSVCFIVIITTVIVSYRSPPSLLLPSFYSVIRVLLFACPYIYSVLVVPAVPEESLTHRAVSVAAIPRFLLCIRGYLNFCRNKLLVELVWI